MFYAPAQLYSLLYGIFVYLVDFSKAESPANPIHQYHPNDVTMVYNFTLFILPYPKADAEELAKPYPLLTPGFKAANGTAPIFLQFGHYNDIRISVFKIEQFMSATLSIPFVERIENSKSFFSFSKYSFQDSLLNTAFATLQGFRIKLSSFKPAHEAYSTKQGVASFEVNLKSIFNTPVFEASWSPLSGSQTPEYSFDTYKQLTNGFFFGDGPKCGMITSFYNYTFTQPTFVQGNVTLHGSADGGYFLQTMQFNNVHGLTVTIAKMERTFPPLECGEPA